jgi:hypothetical protein
LSRHRKNQRSRSKAVALIAAGAFTVAAAGAPAAATWTSGPPSAPAGGAPEADAGALLAVTGQGLQMTAFQQSTASQAVQAYRIRDAAAELAAAHWNAVRVQATREAAASGSPQQIAAAMLASFGWSSGQFSCLDPLWAHESGWSVTAYNAGSGAYGIPQALPGSKMASAGPDWQTDAATQIRWGLEYIKNTYGSPCAAWDHEQATGWY